MKSWLVICSWVVLVLNLSACSSTGTPVQKLAKSMDKTEQSIVKVREYKYDGESRAVVSPADQKQLRITF